MLFSKVFYIKKIYNNNGINENFCGLIIIGGIITEQMKSERKVIGFYVYRFYSHTKICSAILKRLPTIDQRRNSKYCILLFQNDKIILTLCSFHLIWNKIKIV